MPYPDDPTIDRAKPRSGAGDMAARVRDFDWRSTSLGHPSAWPPSLRTAVGICLNSRFPMFVWWGPELISIYNDAYVPVLGKRHPAAFGRPARSTWEDVWDVVGPQATLVVRDGQATWNERVMLVTERNGFAEQAWFTWSYSPIPDDAGGIGGLFCAVTEDTGRVLAERERDRLADQRQIALDAARLGWWHYDPVTKIASWDERYKEIFGVSGNKRPNEEILRRIHPDDLPNVWAAVEAALDPRDPRPYSSTYRIRADDGSVRWVEAHGLATFDGEGPRRKAVSFVGTVADISARRQAEAIHQFLVALDDAIRPLSDPTEITLAAATLLGRHLGVDRCAYADVEDDQDTMNLAGNYLRAPEIRSIVGRLKFADFGAEVLALMRADGPYVVHDVDTHEPPVGDKAAYLATQIQAVICVPLHKGGRFVAAMAVHTATPRRWDAGEVDLVRQVAGRCWESIERARVTRTLRQSEERYRTLFEAIDQGFCVVEILLGASGEPADYRFLEANPAFSAQTGLKDAVGRTALELVPGLDRWWIETYGRVGITGEPARFENHAKAMNRWFEVYAFRFGRAEDRHVAIFFKNITERKRAESRDGLLIELDNATRPLTNPDEINRVSTEVLGRHLGADRCLYITFTEDQDTFDVGHDYVRGIASMAGRYRLSDFGAEPERRFRAGESLVIEDVETHVAPMGDAGAWLRMGIRASASVPLLKNGRLVAAMGVHQTVRREWSDAEIEKVTLVVNRCWESIERAKVARSLEQSLAAEKAARAEAERAGRMKDEFLASLSHELRTPLNAILGWSQILRHGTTDAEDLRQGLETIERNARAQTQIIGDLLDMSRIISGNLRLDVQRVEVGDVVREAVATVRHAAEAKGVRLTAVLDPQAGTVSGDPARLQQVFWNLLSNAVKFTPKGGRVQVELARVNSHLEVRVTDTGEGIAPEFLPHVFDRFRQADASTTRRHGGLGLGLSIARQLVELHGGLLRAASLGVGMGSTFTVSLPATPVNPQREPRGADRHPHGRSAVPVDTELCVEIAGVKVLVVDDEPDARALIRRLLEDCDAVVATAESAGAALRAMEADVPDVLVSDIGMPDEDGYSLIRRVRTLGPDRGGRVPAVALTAYARSEDRTRSIAEGFQMHVAKPVEAAELITVVASLAGRTGGGNGYGATRGGNGDSK